MSEQLENFTRTAIAAVLFFAIALSSGTAGAASTEELDAHVRQSIEDLFRSSSAAKELSAKSVGMLVFPTVVKAGFLFGAEYGEGALQLGATNLGYYNIVSASYGLQAGVQEKSVVLMFMTGDALNKFLQRKGWKVGVDGSVAIATLGVGEELDTETLKKPIIGFEFSNRGLMANLTLEGSKISRVEKK
ncbi:MAG TPA: YSC84-related protein [Burkholderiaceae bacterium]|jgi:lipid-binding SYLF domain-containing protein|nr:YSC84-related protein [Burkholderiaceae bacterium]